MKSVNREITAPGELVPVTGDDGDAAGGQQAARVPLRELMDDRLLDALPPRR